MTREDRRELVRLEVCPYALRKSTPSHTVWIFIRTRRLGSLRIKGLSTGFGTCSGQCGIARRGLQHTAGLERQDHENEPTEKPSCSSHGDLPG